MDKGSVSSRAALSWPPNRRRPQAQPCSITSTVPGVFIQPLFTCRPQALDLSLLQQSARELLAHVFLRHFKITFISIKEAHEKGKKLHWGHFYCITTTQVQVSHKLSSSSLFVPPPELSCLPASVCTASRSKDRPRERSSRPAPKGNPSAVVTTQPPLPGQCHCPGHTQCEQSQLWSSGCPPLPRKTPRSTLSPAGT